MKLWSYMQNSSAVWFHFVEDIVIVERTPKSTFNVLVVYAVFLLYSSPILSETLMFYWCDVPDLVESKLLSNSLGNDKPVRM